MFSDFIFLITNIVLLIPNFADSVYFRFTMKRMTVDIFKYISTGNDTVDMMPQFILDYWYVFLLWSSAIFLIIVIMGRIKISKRYVMQSPISYYFSQSVVMFFLMALTLLGIRGGIQLKPVGLLSASQYAPSQETPIVLNSAFTLMRSSGQKGLPRINYYHDQEEMRKIFDAQKLYLTTDSLGNKLPMLKKNVFIIILESFSTEHIGALSGLKGNPKSDFTPFLDSLIEKSFVAEGFANGKRSMEGIPAILASLPTWMDAEFITSQYSANNFNSLASLLKNEGYSTSFFHGGKNGTMGFDAFSHSAGFDNYFGKDEYPDQSDFDGFWGISDEPYLQYIAQKLNSMNQPFMCAVFTLSSHHPYKVPAKYKNRFRKGPLEIQETIMYSDFALKEFFAKVSTMPWFQDALFVITADHTSEARQPFYQNRVGQYCIPIVFYQPGSSLTGRKKIIAQQTDIMPTILDMLHYQKPFLAFGGSLLREKEPRFDLSYLNGNYQLIYDGYAYQSDIYSVEELYNFVNDSLLTKNVAKLEKKNLTESDRLLRAIIQQYNNRMLDNKLTIQ